MPPKSNPVEELYTNLYNTTSTTAYAPLTYTTNNCTIASYPSVNMSYASSASEEIKEYTNKTDAHIDHLEEDIEFLNEERKYLIEELKKKDDDLRAAHTRITDTEARITQLESSRDALANEVDWMMAQLQKLITVEVKV